MKTRLARKTKKVVKNLVAVTKTKTKSPTKKAKSSRSKLSETFVEKKKRADEVVSLLKRYYPNAECALHHGNPYELLLATILSAQCTDERVNMVTPYLFEQFPKPSDLAKAKVEDIEQVIRSINFYRNKAKSLKACAQALVELHNGEVPQTVEQLVKLAGVGRKTANVVLGVGFKIPSGIVVDTHVARLSNRLAFVRTLDPEKIEKGLQEIIEKQNWIEIAHLLITHGRQICKARNPQCEICFLNELCPKIGVERKAR